MLVTLCLILELLGGIGLAADKPAAAAKAQAALDAKIAESTRRAQLKCPEAFEAGTVCILRLRLSLRYDETQLEKTK